MRALGWVLELEMTQESPERAHGKGAGIQRNSHGQDECITEEMMITTAVNTGTLTVRPGFVLGVLYKYCLFNSHRLLLFNLISDVRSGHQNR